jgi:ribosomal-protein-alanine N-acetyltransferase
MYNIRKFRPDDVEQIYKLDHLLFNNGSSRSEIENKIGWIAHIDNNIVGYLLYYQIDEKNYILDSLGVETTYQNQGIGSDLMYKLINIVDKFNINIHLNINKSQLNLIDFYTKFNFELKTKHQKRSQSISLYRRRHTI